MCDMNYVIISFLVVVLSNPINLKATNPEHERPSITFVFSKDDRDHFAASAINYYKTEEKARTQYIDHTCRSFSEILERLRILNQNHEQPWGLINIVSHGNPWTGLSLPIVNEGERLTKSEMIHQLIHGKLMPLQDHQIDHKTIVNIKACGVGSNPDLLEVMSIALGGYDALRPQVFSSDNFIQYVMNESGFYEERKFQPFYTFYKTAFRPAYSFIALDLKRKYPEEQLNWLDILLDEHKSNDVFVDRFNVPILWHHRLKHPFNKNDFEQDEDLHELVQSNESLFQLINDYEIPIHQFRWTVVDSPDKDPLNVIIKGKATVLCILQKV